MTHNAVINNIHKVNYSKSHYPQGPRMWNKNMWNNNNYNYNKRKTGSYFNIKSKFMPNDRSFKSNQNSVANYNKNLLIVKARVKARKYVLNVKNLVKKVIIVRQI